MEKSIQRRKTKTIYVGNLPVGSEHPISVQSMTKTPTADVKSTIKQILEYEKAGCQIVRATVNNEDAANALIQIKENIHIPLVADIHFQHKLALMAVKNGADKIRINPGNIGDKNKIKEVLSACNDKGIPIRIGVNSGSLEKDILKKYFYPCSQGMVESAIRHIEICEENNFSNLIIAMKSSDVFMMIDAYRKLKDKCDYPFHLGVTEAGTQFQGTIKSSIGIGTLLAEGIGDTIRVSLTDEGQQEIKVGREILRSLNLTSFGANIISCPTCGRLEVDLISIVNKIEKAVENIKKPIKIAVMGCVVNGPGEAQDADIGIAAGKNSAILYIKGKKSRTIKEENIVNELLEEISNFNS